MVVLRFLVDSKIWIALAATFLCLGTYHGLGEGLHWNAYLGVVFFATLLEYNFHRFRRIKYEAQWAIQPELLWLHGRPLLFYGFMLATGIGLLYCLIQLDTSTLCAIMPLAGITLFYASGQVLWPRLKLDFRRLPYLKIFVVALVWTLVTTWIPLIQTTNWNQTQAIGLLLGRFLFFFALILPFDVRDLSDDARQGLRTIPMLLGTKNTMYVTYIALFISMLNMLYVFPGYAESLVLLMAYGLSFALLGYRPLRQSPYYHVGYLDGLILLQGVLLCLG